MLISSTHHHDSVASVVKALDLALDHDIVTEEDERDAVRSFLTALSILSKEDPVTFCRHKDYTRMSDNEDKLLMLEGYGVDNWDGYGDAMEEFHTSRGIDY